MKHASAFNAYKSVGVQSSMMDASPHQMIAMLLDGALGRIAVAKGAIERNNITQKGETISRAIAIVDSLRASLDYDRGGEVAQNLGSLYDYMERLLLDASMNSDIAKLDEVSTLLKEIKTGWNGMPEEAKQVRSHAGS